MNTIKVFTVKDEEIKELLIIGNLKEKIKNYLLQLIEKRDIGSDFDKKNFGTQNNNSVDLGILEGLGYGAFLIESDGNIVGHRAFQIQDGIIYCFSTGISDGFRGNKFGLQLLHQFSSQIVLDTYTGIKIGKGNKETDNVNTYALYGVKNLFDKLKTDFGNKYIFELNLETHLITWRSQ